MAASITAKVILTQLYGRCPVTSPVAAFIIT
jgi:hypothetical protein